ncbi:MAG: hypothetical protein U1E39_18290 [Planctomycetota bacterium]
MFTAPRVRADTDPWEVLVRGATPIRDVVSNLDAIVLTLDGARQGTLSGIVTAYTPDEGERTALAERADAALGAARAALDGAGLLVEGLEGLSVVVVRSASGGVGAGVSPSGRAVFVRERTGSAPAPLVPLRRPADGPPNARDVVAASDLAILSLDARAGAAAASGGPGSLGHVIARAAVGHARLPASTPTWFREGLVAWAESAGSPERAGAAAHLCGGPIAAGVAQLLSPKTRPTPSQTRVLGRLVAALLEGQTDGAARVERIAAAGEKAAAVVAELLGKDPATVLAEGVPTGERPACDVAGTLPCPVCKGGKIEVACDTCVGLGGVACPSCQGNPRCIAPGCVGGVQLRKDGAYKCGLCYGTGWGLCKTCGDKPKFPCKVCGGSGRQTRPCYVCSGRGRVACADGGLAPPSDGPAVPCAWCGTKAPKVACTRCAGSGFVGCLTCAGSGYVPCKECEGLGCKTCRNIGGQRCPDGDGTKWKCPDCEGVGAIAAVATRCLACGGREVPPDGAFVANRVALRLRGLDAAERKRVGEVLAGAVRFLLASQRDGRFALREQRWIPTGALGDLEKPNAFSNAITLWALLSARVDRRRPGMDTAWEHLRADAESLADGSAPDAWRSVQTVSLVLRALLAGDEPADSPRVAGLVKVLVAAQRPGGYWDDRLDSKDPGDAFQSLFAVESLWLAQRRGVKVPIDTFSRAMTAGAKVGGAIPKSMRRNGFLTATDVASGAALLVMAKAGTQGDKARNLEEYRSIPQVAQALAWLDRHFEIVREPMVVAGARTRDDGDGGWAAWVYAAERLARLLSIDQMGGRRWYSEGCRYMATLQKPDGSFEELGRGRINGPVRTTASVVLFLVRATPPLTGEAPADEEEPVPADGDGTK